MIFLKASASPDSAPNSNFQGISLLVTTPTKSRVSKEEILSKIGNSVYGAHPKLLNRFIHPAHGSKFIHFRRKQCISDSFSLLSKIFLAMRVVIGPKTFSRHSVIILYPFEVPRYVLENQIPPSTILTAEDSRFSKVYSTGKPPTSDTYHSCQLDSCQASD